MGVTLGIAQDFDTSESSKLFKYTVLNYSDLSSLVDVNEGDIAWVQNYSILTPTRFSGAWQYLSGVWVYGSKELQDQVSTNIAEIQQNEDDIIDLQNNKTDKGGYSDTSQDLKNEIDQNTSDVSGKLDKGSYVGDAQDLKNDIDQEATDRTSADSNLQSQITSNDSEISSLQSNKLDKGGYAGNAQDLDDAINAIDGSETKIVDGNNTTVTGTGTVGNPYQLEATPSGGLTPEQLQIISGSITMFNATGVSLNAASSPINIPMTNIVGVNNLGYNIIGGALVIPVTGWYTIAANVNAQGDNNRKNAWFQILRNGVAIQGMASSGYSRNNSSNNFASAMSARFPSFAFAAGDTIDIQWNYDGDGGTITTFPQEAWLTLEFKGN